MSSNGESASSRWALGSAPSPGFVPDLSICCDGVLPVAFFSKSMGARAAGVAMGFVAGVAGFWIGLAATLFSGFFFVTALATSLAFWGFGAGLVDFFAGAGLCVALSAARGFAL